MINRLVLTAAIQLLTVPLLGIEALYAQKADPIAPAEPLEDGWESMDDRLLFLMTRLASVEASLEAVEKAISVAGGKKSRALADIRRADTGNELMDRKAGGPMKWSEFYGRTAEKFFYHPVDARTTYHTVTILGVENGGRQALPPHQRPPQLDYIYRANESVKARAEKEAAELGKKMDDLLARRRSLEEEQSGLWCEVAFRAVSRLDLPRKPLYRFELASASSEPSDGEKKEALNAALAFCQTAFSIVAAAESSQANAFGGIKKTIRDARERLDDAWVRKTGLASQIGDLKTSPGRFAALAKRLEDVSSNLADSYLVSIDGDRFKDEQRKDTFRGLLQHSLLSYAQITLALDEMATAMSKDWSIAPEIGKVAVRDGKIETRTATTQAAATEIGKPAATDREIPPSELPSGDLTSLRWLNTSYDTTLYHVEGKRWAVMDNKTKEVKSQLEEVGRGPNYIELFVPNRQRAQRFYDTRADVKLDGQWTWLANGYWIDSLGRRVAAPWQTTPLSEATSPIPQTLRWLNTSYDTTLYHVEGKRWEEMENKTKKVRWQLDEISRGPDYIELFLPDRQQTLRVYDKRVDFKVSGKWQWLSNGYWVDSSGHRVGRKP